MNDIPRQMADWYASLPSQNCGTLYATIKAPFVPIYTEHKVPIWGQVCDGKDHRDGVHTALLYNNFPFHGKGFTYVSWRAVPDNPNACKYPLSGKVENPLPYSGIPYSSI
jgi:hypothetical protein